MVRFGITILVSAFLVFQVQPVIARFILPWHGGAPAVWTTCLLFFQALARCDGPFGSVLGQGTSFMIFEATGQLCHSLPLFQERSCSW